MYTAKFLKYKPVLSNVATKTSGQTDRQTDIQTDGRTDRQTDRQSIQGKGAGAWLNAIPSSSKLALVSLDFRLAACLRLGLAMPFNGCIPQCDCSSYLDGLGYHLMSCKWGGGPVWTHECLSNVWSDCLRSLQMHHRRGPCHRYITSDNRPDITVFDFGSGSNTDLDVFGSPVEQRGHILFSVNRRCRSIMKRTNKSREVQHGTSSQ